MRYVFIVFVFICGCTTIEVTVCDDETRVGCVREYKPPLNDDNRR